jgi:hypothetical protein
MDKYNKTKLFQIQKQHLQDIGDQNKKDNQPKNRLSDIILYMKCCFYKSELDKFIKHVNDLFPYVKKNFNIVLLSTRYTIIYTNETNII